MGPLASRLFLSKIIDRPAQGTSIFDHITKIKNNRWTICVTLRVIFSSSALLYFICLNSLCFVSVISKIMMTMLNWHISRDFRNIFSYYFAIYEIFYLLNWHKMDDSLIKREKIQWTFDVSNILSDFLKKGIS